MIHRFLFLIDKFKYISYFDYNYKSLGTRKFNILHLYCICKNKIVSIFTRLRNKLDIKASKRRKSLPECMKIIHSWNRCNLRHNSTVCR